LWIAYNFLSLQGSLQFMRRVKKKNISCELLTIFYLYKVLCSYADSFLLCALVVNCLQFFIFTRFFAVSKTLNPCNACCELLTIFYLYKVLCSNYLRTFSRTHRCELLTIFYLYKVLCSISVPALAQIPVVNCLQFFIFTRFFAVNI